MQHINRYPVWPDGWRKKQSGLGPLSGTLIEEYDARACFDPHDLAVAGNPWGLPNFLWIDDGAGWTLSSNASLDMSTVVGAPVSGSATPYQYPDGSTNETCEYYNGAPSYRYDNTHPLSWDITDDIVFICKFRMHNNYTATTDRYDIWSNNYHAESGIFFYIADADDLKFTFVYKPASTSATVNFSFTPARRTWHTACVIVDRSDERFYSWLDGVTPGITSGSSLINNLAYNGIGMCLGARMPGGAVTYPALPGVCISWIGIWNGADLYEAWTADSEYLLQRIMFESLGLRETVASPRKIFSYARTSLIFGGDNDGTSYIDHLGNWVFTDEHVPAAGNPNGALLNAMGYNRAVDGNVRNFHPANTTGWTATGGTLSVVSDAAALAAVQADIWGPNVYSFENTSGSAQRIYCGSNCALNAICQFMILARYTAGSGGTMGWRDASSGVYTSVGTITNSASYVITDIAEQTSGGADWKFCIELPNNCTLLFIAQTLNTYTVANQAGRSKYPIPYNASAFSSGQGHECDNLLTQHTPVAGSGTYLINAAPAGWGGTPPRNDTSFLSCATTPGDILHAEFAAAGWATSDGTTQISTGAPVDGTYMDVWSAWQGALQYVQQGIVATPVTGAYDGDKGCAGVLRTGIVANAVGGDYWVKTIQIRQI